MERGCIFASCDSFGAPCKAEHAAEPEPGRVRFLEYHRRFPLRDGEGRSPGLSARMGVVKIARLQERVAAE